MATIVIDFDGTVVRHEFPLIGDDIGAVPVLQRLVEHGHKLVLFTMRSDIKNPKSEDPNIACVPGNYLTEAVQWFKDRGIPLFGIQTNPTQKCWTKSPKAYGNYIIDDAAIGCPLIYPVSHTMHGPVHGRGHVNWPAVEKLLEAQGLFMTISKS